MKKFIAILMVATMVLSLFAFVGCTEKKENLKLGLGVVTSVSATDATDEANGQGKATITAAAVLVDANGKIVKATAGPNTERLNKILDTDEGARYFGEFALGVNPHITKPMLDTLFDEKIEGSLHFTPGKCYDEADNGNRSAIHWDMVLIQTPEYGGGEIWFDDVLVRKDGRFVLPELEGLNPENLD